MSPAPPVMLLLCVVSASAGTPAPPIAVPSVANDTWVDAGWGTWLVGAETGLTGPHFGLFGGDGYPVPTLPVCKQGCIERTGCKGIAYQVSSPTGLTQDVCIFFFSSVATCMSADGLNRVECWGLNRIGIVGGFVYAVENMNGASWGPTSAQAAHVDAYKAVVYAGDAPCPGADADPAHMNLHLNNCTLPIWGSHYPTFNWFTSVLVPASPSTEKMSPQKQVRHDVDALRSDVDSLRSALATALAKIASLESAIGAKVVEA